MSFFISATFTAIASLLDGEKAEEIVQRLDGSELLGVSVSVELYFNENLLCVTHLPLNFTDEDFKSLATPHGAVERCFLLRSEKTGTHYVYMYELHVVKSFSLRFILALFVYLNYVNW